MVAVLNTILMLLAISWTVDPPPPLPPTVMPPISVLNENACSFESISDKPKFNLVYIDPPYNKNLVTRSIKNILKKNLINKNSILVIEEERKSKDILIPELKIERVKELGISKFSFYRLT